MGAKRLDMHSRSADAADKHGSFKQPQTAYHALLSHRLCTYPGDGRDKGTGGASWDTDATENYSNRLRPHSPHSSLCELCTA